jgi:CubicO group peptidase (beta-lactamase class C family)
MRFKLPWMMRNRGLLNLDDPLATYIPEFANAIPRKGDLKDVTLRRMLCHRSGLMGGAPTGGVFWDSHIWPDMSEILEVIPQIEVSIEPGSAFKYSNLAFGLLGEVISRVSGQAYEKFIASEILEPLGLESTAFEPNAELKSRIATGYQHMTYEDVPDETPFPSLGGQVAMSQLYTTVEDLARWIVIHLGPAEGEPESEVLPARSRVEMQRPAYIEEDWSAGYALPWMMHRANDDTIRGRGGAMHGYGSDISFIAGRRIGVIALFDRMLDLKEISSSIFEIVSEAEDTAIALEPNKKLSPTPPELKEYLGLYHGTFQITWTVEFREDALRTTTTLGDLTRPSIMLEPTEESDVFRATSGRLSGDKVVFTRSDDGAVNGVIAEAMLFRRLAQADDGSN